jgi:hypothetical protein
VFLLNSGNPPLQPLTYAAEIISSASAPIGISRRTFRRLNFTSVSVASANIITNVTSHSGRIGVLGADGTCFVPSVGRAVVVTVIDVLVPALTDVGVKDAVAPAGSPVVVKVIVPGKLPPIGAVAIVKFVDWPAVTVSVVVVAVTLKSALIVNVSAFDVVPDGAPAGCAPPIPPATSVGVNTVTDAVPAVAISAAVIAAVNCVALTNVVVRLLPFHCATDVLMKFDPFSVNVNAGPAAVAELGDSEASTGTGVVIVNVSVFDVPPPGVGLITSTDAMPKNARSLAGTLAVNCVALTNVVASAAPFQCATELAMKFVPVRVNVNPTLPALAEFGESEVSVGTGFAALIVNVNAFDVVPEGAPEGRALPIPLKTMVGVNTVTDDVPTVAISVAGTAAVNCVAFTNVVVRLPPFHCTTEVLMKLPPFTVNVNAGLPAITEFGTSEPSDGTGVVTVKVTAFDVPPPGVGLTTLTKSRFAVKISAAVIAAVNVVAFTNVVTRGLPFHCTAELLTKPLPFTVNVNPGEPALIEFGEIEVIPGTGLLAAVIVNVSEFDGPPPGFGLLTKTAGVPTLATSVARIVAITCVEFTNVVALFAPPKFTSAPLTKPVPFTVNVNPADPAAIVFGDNDVTVGTGFSAAVMVNVAEFDWPPPGVGFVTVTRGVPTLATSVARIAAVT